MKIGIRNIIIAVCATVTAGGLAATYLAGVSYRRPLVCTGLEIAIVDSTCNSFVNKDDIRRYIDKEYGNCKDVALTDIDLNKIETILETKSAVNTTEAFVTKDGRLNISVTQRRPTARFQGAKTGYYADAEGRTFPLQSSYTSHVPVIDGYIPAMTDTLRIRRITEMVNILEGSDNWKDRIVQITMDPKGNITLIPREGSERFIIGQPSSIKDKIRKMEIYYTHILPGRSEKQYRTIDLRYDGQIVCR